MEVILPLEYQIPSLRIVTQEDNARLHIEELEALDENRLEAQQWLECYQARLFIAFNKKVRPRSFKKGDLVLAVRRPIITTHRTENKFTSKWDGPYVIQEVYSNGAYKLVTGDGLRWPYQRQIFEAILPLILKRCSMLLVRMSLNCECQKKNLQN